MKKWDAYAANGWLKFFEHWHIVLLGVAIFLVSQVIDFFMELNGVPWIVLCVAGLALMVVGGSLIGYAKLPVYRRGRYFTLGLNSVPREFAGHYRWGWRVFLLGTGLSLCLMLSNL